MRLTPIDKPRSWIVRFGYWLSRRRLGKVMAPLRVIYARWPKLMLAQRKLFGMLEDDRVVPARLRHLLSTWVSTLNGCSFCADLHQAQAVQDGEYDDLAALASFRESDRFTAAEKAALAYAEEVTLYKKVSDETFGELRAHFSEDRVVRLAWFVAMMNYFNLMAVPLGLGSDGLCQLALEKKAA